MSFVRKVLCGLDTFKEWALSTFSPKDHNHDSKYALKSQVASVGISFRSEDIAVAEKDNEKYENANGQMVANANNITVDEWCDTNVLKSGNTIPSSFRINGEMFDFKEYWEDPDEPGLTTITIGNFYIVTGFTPPLQQTGINQLIRVYIPYIRSLVGVNLTPVFYFNRNAGSEKSAHYVAFIDNWLYVLLDGAGAYNEVGLAFTVFGKR